MFMNQTIRVFELKLISLDLSKTLRERVLRHAQEVQLWLNERSTTTFDSRTQVGEHNQKLAQLLGISTTQVNQIMKAAGVKTLPTRKTLERLAAQKSLQEQR